MKIVLFDTNVILDILLLRKKLYEASALALSLAEKKQITGLICATAVPLIFYLIEKERGKKVAEKSLENLLNIIDIAVVDNNIIKLSLKSEFKDFEDAIIYYSAINNRADMIITRNKKDFKNSKLPVLTPEELLAMIKK